MVPSNSGEPALREIGKIMDWNVMAVLSIASNVGLLVTGLLYDTSVRDALSHYMVRRGPELGFLVRLGVLGILLSAAAVIVNVWMVFVDVSTLFEFASVLFVGLFVVVALRMRKWYVEAVRFELPVRSL